MGTSRNWSCITAAAALVLALGGVSAFGASVEIISPSAGSELNGSVKVTARVAVQPGETLDKVMLQTSRGDMVRMAPEFADTYSATLDTTALRNGRQPLLVVASARGENPSVLHPDRNAWQSTIRNWEAEIQVMVANPYHYYWGDLHAHTSYSDGAGLPKDAYAFARDKAHLDFFAVTDHSPLLTFDEYQDVIAQAEQANQPGRFAALWGFEEPGTYGHICFYMTSTPSLPGRLDALYQAAGEMGLVGHFNHPSVTTQPGAVFQNDFEGFRYVATADRAMAVVEVKNTNQEAAYIKLLDSGWHVGAAGCEDQHEQTWGMGKTWTVALAPALTRETILEALRSRRTYSAADRNLELSFTVDGEDMGAQIARPAGKLTCLVTVLDPDPDDVIDHIDLVLDGQMVATIRPKLTRYAWSVPVEFLAGRHYCFVRVGQAGDRLTWSSPVWVEAY